MSLDKGIKKVERKVNKDMNLDIVSPDSRKFNDIYADILREAECLADITVPDRIVLSKKMRVKLIAKQAVKRIKNKGNNLDSRRYNITSKKQMIKNCLLKIPGMHRLKDFYKEKIRKNN